MAEEFKLHLTENVALKAREMAAQRHLPVEDVLAEWIEHFLSEPPIETLPDSEVVALAGLEMDMGQQAELSELLWGNEEGNLNAAQQERLDELLKVYRKGMVRKAQALQVAIARGLLPPLN